MLAAPGWDDLFDAPDVSRRRVPRCLGWRYDRCLPFRLCGMSFWLRWRCRLDSALGALPCQASLLRRSKEFWSDHVGTTCFPFCFLSPLIWLPVLAFLGLCLAGWSRRYNLALAIALADLLIYSQFLNVAQPVREIYPELSAFESVSSYRQTFPARQPVLRSAGWKRMAHANSLSSYGFCDVSAYQGMLLQGYQTLLKSINVPESAEVLIGLHDPIHYSPGLADLLGVGFHYSDPLQMIAPPFGPSDVPKIPATDWNVAPWKSAKRAYLVGAARSGSKQDVLKWVLDPNFDPRHCVYITNSQLQVGSPEPQQGEAGEIGEVDWELYDTNRIALSCTAPKRAWLLVNDTYYKGWEATVDGQPVPLLVADYAFRAVELAAGHHRVVMKYRPKSVTVGLPVALLSTMSLMIIGWFFYRKEKFGRHS